MTIRPGADWGEAVARPDDLVEIASDAALADWVERADPRPVLLTGGELLRTVGGPSPGPQLRRLLVDVLRVDADGRLLTATAHVVARRRGRTGWWRGPITGVMNTDHLGRWDVAPTAHPNDGRLDVIEVDASLGPRARWQAWRRLPTGTHVPHPGIRTRRAAEVALRFDRPLTLWIDGVERGTVRSLDVTVVPDGATVHT